MNRIILSAFSLVIAANTYSANVATGFFKVDKVRVSDHTGNAYIDPVGSPETINESCSKRILYAFHKNDTLFSEIYSTALTAAASGKQVKVWVSDDTDDCLSGFQRVRVIEVDF